MATIVTRAGNGSPLTNNQVDANFTNLNDELGTAVQKADFNAGTLLYATADDTPQPISIADLKLLLGDGVPVGTIIDSMASSPPTGYLNCDGSAVSRTTYAALFAAIGTSCGHGDGSTTFNLPEDDGKFKRGTDNGAGNDPDASTRTAQATGGNTGDDVGSVQDDAVANHTHRVEGINTANVGDSGGISTADALVTGATWGDHHATSDWNWSTTDAYGNVIFHRTSYNRDGASQTRPPNFNVNFYIKY